MQFRKVTAEVVVLPRCIQHYSYLLHTHLISASPHLPTSSPEHGGYMLSVTVRKVHPPTALTGSTRLPTARKYPRPVLSETNHHAREPRCSRHLVSSSVSYHLLVHINARTSYLTYLVVSSPNALRHKSTPDNSEPLGHSFPRLRPDKNTFTL